MPSSTGAATAPLVGRYVDVSSSQFIRIPMTFGPHNNHGGGSQQQSSSEMGAMAPPMGPPSYITTQVVAPRFTASFSSGGSWRPSQQVVGSDEPLFTYRRYRKGDVPDINLSVKDILRPLQALCLHDAACASLVGCAVNCVGNVIGTHVAIRQYIY